MKKHVFFTLAVLALAVVDASAQKIALGAAYELQNADPNQGQSIRIETRLLNLKVISLHTRVQATRFTEDLTIDAGGSNQDIAAEAMTFDFTAAGIAYLNLPLLPVSPYLGVGVGFDRSKFNVLDAAVSGVEDEAKSAIAYSTIVGIRLKMIPIVKPFVEYRYAGLSKEPPQQLDRASGRLSFGVALAF